MKDFIISEKPNKFICKLCNKPKGSHKANTFNCPLGKGAFKNFHENQLYFLEAIAHVFFLLILL